MEAPPLLSSRSPGMQLVLGDVVPCAYGALCGVVLGASKPLYLLLSLLAAVGGFLAGFEHRGAGEGVARGLVGGLLFGTFILLAHRITGAHPKASLPNPEIVLVVLTALFGAGLGAAGGALRARRSRGPAPNIPPSGA